MTRLEKNALRAYRARWEAVAEVEAQELKQATIQQRWQKLTMLLRSAVLMGWFPKMQERNQQEAEEVRVRWNKLKDHYQ